ncbi:hypothetical protein LNY03_28855, partial [Pseudomonas nitroreducens]|uniref:hypothetical protein n=1 Tax=Pseudomonas nitroreducens TaxID=46680 RepID=UPI001FB727EB
NTFLFFDDFSGPTLTDKWNINGNVQLANGIVTLSDNQWIWTKDTFPDSFIIDFRANINGNPGFMWYIDPSSGWGYINDINYFSYPNRG